MTHPLHGFRPLDPPPELRARVLAAAREAAQAPPPDWLDRLYESGRFWLAATALAVALLVALSLPFPSSSASAAPPIAASQPPGDEPSGPTLAEQWPRVSRELLLPWGAR